MSLEESTDNVSELEVIATLPKNEQSARKKLTVSFADNLTDDIADRTLSQGRRSSFYDQSWHRKDSSTRVKDSNKIISFHDIVYQVPVKKWCREQPPKVILNRIRYECVYLYCLHAKVLYCLYILQQWSNEVWSECHHGSFRQWKN